MKEKKNIEFFNRELLAKYLCYEVNPVEKSEVEAWLAKTALNREELEQYRKMLDSVDTFYAKERYNSVEAFNNVKAKMNAAPLKVIQRKKTGKEVLARFYKYAAIIIIAITVGTAGYYFGIQNRGAEIYTEIISTPLQVINEYTLPDGSVVALNSNSKLVYPKHFTGETREVTIEGEAFFDIKSNHEKPFIIHAGNADVKVIGTSFNVSAYPDAETVEVVVASGKVQVISKNNSAISTVKEVVLIPGEKGTLLNSGKTLEKSENLNPNYLSWKTHDFIFSESPLDEVFSCLEKTYHVKIQVTEPGLNSLKLNARFDKKPIDFILNVVRLTFNLELSVVDDKYTFSSRTNI